MIKITEDIYFDYSALGEPNFIKNGATDVSKENAISLRHWKPEQLEAMANYMRENPPCTLFRDGSGK